MLCYDCVNYVMLSISVFAGIIKQGRVVTTSGMIVINVGGIMLSQEKNNSSSCS